MTSPLAREQRYALVEGLVRTVVDGVYVVEGGPVRVSLSGAGATDMLPDLCELLDGTRSVGDLAAALALHPDDVVEAVALLHRMGLAEEAGPDLAPEEQPEARAFFSRSEAYATRAGSGAQAVRRLSAARVLIAGQGALAELVQRTLAAQGIAVAPYSKEGLARLPGSDGLEPPAGVVVEIRAPASVSSGEVLAACAARRVVWIGVGLTEEGGVVGPLAHPVHACLECVGRSLAESGALVGDTAAPGVVPLLAGVTAGEVLHVVAGIGANQTAGALVRLTSDAAGRTGLYMERAKLHARIECVSCGAGAGGGERAQLAWDYEQEIALPPPSSAVRGRVQADSRELQRAVRDMPTSPAVPAPAATAWPLTEMFSVLRRSAGLRTTRKDGVPLWNKPSAGNLNSQLAYVVSAEELAGLGSCTALYHPLADRLMATGRICAGEAAEAAATVVAPGWRWLLVWVADVDRLAAKYEDFAVRLALLDSGAALAQTALVARTLGLSPRMPGSWSATEIAGLLDLDPRTDVVTGILVF